MLQGRGMGSYESMKAGALRLCTPTASPCAHPTRPPPHTRSHTSTPSTHTFAQHTAGAERKYFMLGGKGGVGKTSCAASLAVKFATDGYPTLVVSTAPAHSLSDSFDQVGGFGGEGDEKGVVLVKFARSLGDVSAR